MAAINKQNKKPNPTGTYFSGMRAGQCHSNNGTCFVDKKDAIFCCCMCFAMGHGF